MSGVLRAPRERVSAVAVPPWSIIAATLLSLLAWSDAGISWVRMLAGSAAAVFGSVLLDGALAACASLAPRGRSTGSPRSVRVAIGVVSGMSAAGA